MLSLILLFEDHHLLFSAHNIDQRNASFLAQFYDHPAKLSTGCCLNRSFASKNLNLFYEADCSNRVDEEHRAIVKRYVVWKRNAVHSLCKNILLITSSSNHFGVIVYSSGEGNSLAHYAPTKKSSTAFHDNSCAFPARSWGVLDVEETMLRVEALHKPSVTWVDWRGHALYKNFTRSWNRHRYLSELDLALNWALDWPHFFGDIV